jgi:hypothetical protein
MARKKIIKLLFELIKLSFKQNDKSLQYTINQKIEELEKLICKL